MCCFCVHVTGEGGGNEGEEATKEEEEDEAKEEVGEEESKPGMGNSNVNPIPRVVKESCINFMQVD